MRSSPSAPGRGRDHERQGEVLVAAPDLKLYRAVKLKVRSRHEPVWHRSERPSIYRFKDVASPESAFSIGFPGSTAAILNVGHEGSHPAFEGSHPSCRVLKRNVST